MDDLDAIREQALETLRLADAELRGKDPMLAAFARRLEDGAVLLPITDKSALLARLRGYVEAHDALAAMTGPEGFGVEDVPDPASRERGVRALDALKATVSFGEIGQLLSGTWSSDAVSGAIRDLHAAMDAHGSAAPAP